MSHQCLICLPATNVSPSLKSCRTYHCHANTPYLSRPNVSHSFSVPFNRSATILIYNNFCTHKSPTFPTFSSVSSTGCPRHSSSNTCHPSCAIQTREHLKGKGKGHPMTCLYRRRYRSTPFPTSAIERDWSAPRSDRFTSGKATRYPLYRRLGGSQGRSGRVWKKSPPPGFDSRTVQTPASRYTD